MTECEDAISRADVDNALYEYWHDINIVDDSGYFIYKDSMDIINKLPSVHPKEKVGKWIESHIPESVLVECSECGFSCGASSFNYCPMCRAKMEGVQE